MPIANKIRKIARAVASFNLVRITHFGHSLLLMYLFALHISSPSRTRFHTSLSRSCMRSASSFFNFAYFWLPPDLPKYSSGIPSLSLAQRGLSKVLLPDSERASTDQAYKLNFFTICLFIILISHISIYFSLRQGLRQDVPDLINPLLAER